jgi:hypothetical protein
MCVRTSIPRRERSRLRDRTDLRDPTEDWVRGTWRTRCTIRARNESYSKVSAEDSDEVFVEVTGMAFSRDLSDMSYLYHSVAATPSTSKTPDVVQCSGF